MTGVQTCALPISRGKGENGDKKGDFRKRITEKFDADKDGKLSEAERKKAHEAFQERAGEGGPLKAKLLEKFDANKNGKLDPEEHENRAAA